MDYLIKMELAIANIDRAMTELKDVDGLEYVVGKLFEARHDLEDELAEYKQHSDLD
jgi:hypothetical protein